MTDSLLIMTSKTRGYLYVLLAVTIFAGQDAFSKLLGEKYPPIMVVMVRFWAFAAFVMLMAAFAPGGPMCNCSTRSW